MLGFLSPLESSNKNSYSAPEQEFLNDGNDRKNQPDGALHNKNPPEDVFIEESTIYYDSKDRYDPNKLDVNNSSTIRSGDIHSSVGLRGSHDLRSPGMPHTPSTDILGMTCINNQKSAVPDFPDLITQTDKYGHVINPQSFNREDSEESCDILLESMRMMCCCLLPLNVTFSMKDVLVGNNKKKLLPPVSENDKGKKCLVLDLDETLVHSSFRVVNGADFVIPVQIDNDMHFVYVIKRPGVDRFLTEMARHYEIVIYTASLNKYADPLLDLLDTGKKIGARLFRDSCVYHEGNYVKDLSLLDRNLQGTIIVDNSPSSYVFQPENAIGCTSFIDDLKDRELDQIRKFLFSVRHVVDVRDVCDKWREWPVCETDD